MQDAARKGRLRTQKHPEQQQGVLHGRSKLTEDQVLELRSLFATGVTTTELGRQFGITQTHASYIVKRKNWKHI